MRCLLLLCALPAFAQSRVALDNPQVHVIDARVAPHQIGKQHEHTLNRVMIYLVPADIRLTHADGRVEQQHWSAGQVAWSPRSGLHTSENTGDQPQRIIELELKEGPRQPVPVSGLDPVKVDAHHYRVLFENDQVRVFHGRYGPREPGVMHDHLRDRVTVFLTDATVHLATPDGHQTTTSYHAGDLLWGGAATHQDDNAGAQPMEMVVVEFKGR